MRMTETMQVLKLLADKGACTLSGVSDATTIPAARVVASLGVLTRSREVTRARGGRAALYQVTEQGAAKVASWALTPGKEAGRG